MANSYFNSLYGDTDSALIGAVPNNQDDLNFVRGLFRTFGIPLDPRIGYPFVPKPPAGYVHESKQATLITFMGIVIAAVIIPTAARILQKRRSPHAVIGLDDYVIVLASAIAAAYPAMVIVMCATAGAGRHTWENTYADFQRFYHYVTVLYILFYLAVGMINLSITLFIRRLAKGTSRMWQIVTDVFLVTVVLFMTGTLLWGLFGCYPSRATWDMWYAGTLAKPATCGSLKTATYILGIVHTVQSVLLLLTPIIILWHVQIDLSKKIRLFLIWASGCFTVTFGLLQVFTSAFEEDIFWDFTGILGWATLDLAMGVLTASLPVLDSSIISMWHAVTTTRARTGNGKDQQGGNKYGWPTTGSATRITVGKNSKYGESVENILPHDDGATLNSIIRTDEIHIHIEDRLP
ncbi:hypothetical protein BX600DRAFT_518033 [Xylariales sp. PMI_506]|nr:hypothetical protein BX600DRAFT_518033 [Xylariales sp. PMI_506]